MSIIPFLASSLNRNDEGPNIELAKQISENGNKKDIDELTENLAHKSKAIKHDCIKVLYEIGSLNPSLISGYADVFIKLLNTNDNRLQWGAMTALNSITGENADIIYEVLPLIAEIADKGSVITRDNYVAILTKLCSVTKYSSNTLILLHEQFLKSPSNQLPMYAENALHIIDNVHKQLFIETLTNRLDDFEKESKRKRIENVIKKLQRK